MEINQLLREQLEKIKSSNDVIDEQFKMCTAKQTQINLVLCDIYHEIELERLSAPEMMQKYKELRSCLKVRRKYKDMLEYINTTKAMLKQDGVEGALKGIKTLEKKEGNKKYHQRIKMELREELLSEMDS